MKTKVKVADQKKAQGESAPQTVRFKKKLLDIIQRDAEENFRTVSRQVNLLVCKAYGLDPKEYL